MFIGQPEQTSVLWCTECKIRRINLLLLLDVYTVHYYLCQCVKTRSFTKLELHNVLQCHQKRTASATCYMYKKLVKSIVQFLRYASGQTDKQRYSWQYTLHPIPMYYAYIKVATPLSRQLDMSSPTSPPSFTDHSPHTPISMTLKTHNAHHPPTTDCRGSH